MNAKPAGTYELIRSADIGGTMGRKMGRITPFQIERAIELGHINRENYHTAMMKSLRDCEVLHVEPLAIRACKNGVRTALTRIADIERLVSGDTRPGMSGKKKKR